MSSGVRSEINTFRQAFTAKCVYVFQEYKPCLWKESLCLGKDSLKKHSSQLLQMRSQSSVCSLTAGRAAVTSVKKHRVLKFFKMFEKIWKHQWSGAEIT